MPKKIAIIGTGISGLSCAHYLAKHSDAELSIFEKSDRVGGHTATVNIVLGGKRYAIDTGFIVFNDRTYPNFVKLLDELGVESQDSEMSFSVRAESDDIEYGRTEFSGLFAQKRNLLRPSHWRMLIDITRFNRLALADLENGSISPEMSLGDYLEKRRFSKAFRDRYLVPMGSAIWSASSKTILDFPILFFAKFFKNHGLLTLTDQPQWKVIKGGSKSYLSPLIAPFSKAINTNTTIHRITRTSEGVRIEHSKNGIHLMQMFDEVVFACHSDEALALLTDRTDTEKNILAAIPYEDNDVVLHTDTSILPRKRSTWSSWNYWVQQSDMNRAVLTYNMNILQGIEAEQTFCVTVNASEHIAPGKVLGRYSYAHPQFSLAGIAAQQRWAEINGTNQTWFAGAYWANGFHEDGCASGFRVAKAIIKQSYEQSANSEEAA